MTDTEVCLAPLHGITNHLLRNALLRHFNGVDLCVSPFIAVQSDGKFNKGVWADIFPENNIGVDLVPQLMGNVPQQFVDTMLYINDNFGYERFNINLGCPSSKVVRHKRGCALMTDPGRVEEIVSLVSSKTNFRVSLKMRLGLKNRNEILDILRRIESYPLDFIVVHPRLGVDLYDGNVDFDTFAECITLTNRRLFYSGDIISKSDFKNVSERFPNVSGWMFGRGLLCNPFLAEEVKEMPVGNRFERFSDFYEDYVNVLITCRAKTSVLSHLKELWHYFAVFCKLPKDELTSMLRLGDLDDFLQLSRQAILTNL